MVDLNKVASFDQGKRYAKRIDPESRRLNRISNSDVAGDALVEAILAEDSESRYAGSQRRSVLCSTANKSNMYSTGRGPSSLI